MAKVGRPSDYTKEKGDYIIERLLDGESLRSICLDESVAKQSTVFRWIHNYEEFRKQYELAREWQAEKFADEMLDIADDSSNDWMEKNAEGTAIIGHKVNGEHVQRSRLRIDTRKWIASKLKPKKYGDKLELSGDEKHPVTFVLRDMTKKD